MHPENKEEIPECRPSDTQKTSRYKLGMAFFTTLFCIWLVVTLIGLLSPDPETLHTLQKTADPGLKAEAEQTIRPGEDGHVKIVAPAEESAPAKIPAAAKPHASATKEHAEPVPTASSHGAAVEPPASAVKVQKEKAEPPKEYPHIVGWSFVRAAMKPMHHELYERFWGWQPNDLLRPTDNVNNFQLGVLEVTRRTAVKLAEDISRTGSTASFDPNLEQAMNWFMIRPEKFWFPSAESKYKAGLQELSKYQEKLIQKKGSFYNRSDNLIPLLIAYKNLLGSCDENLVKAYENDGTKVSFFKADDYFYYAQGVASAMATILEAVEHDFHPILQSRNGLDVLHHAIKSCQKAKKLDPIIILNSDLNGLLANHRANLATHISHARFYIGVLITTLST